MTRQSLVIEREPASGSDVQLLPPQTMHDVITRAPSPIGRNPHGKLAD